MTSRQGTWVVCDRCGAESDRCDGDFPSVLRRDLRTRGWTTALNMETGNRDYCPECSQAKGKIG